VRIDASEFSRDQHAGRRMEKLQRRVDRASRNRQGEQEQRRRAPAQRATKEDGGISFEHGGNPGQVKGGRRRPTDRKPNPERRSAERSFPTSIRGRMRTTSGDLCRTTHVRITRQAYVASLPMGGGLAFPGFR